MYGMKALLDISESKLETIKIKALRGLAVRRTKAEMRQALNEIFVLAEEVREMIGYNYKEGGEQNADRGIRGENRISSDDRAV